jgi:hypothetical protein
MLAKLTEQFFRGHTIRALGLITATTELVHGPLAQRSPTKEFIKVLKLKVPLTALERIIDARSQSLPGMTWYFLKESLDPPLDQTDLVLSVWWTRPVKAP